MVEVCVDFVLVGFVDGGVVVVLVLVVVFVLYGMLLVWVDFW